VKAIALQKSGLRLLKTCSKPTFFIHPSTQREKQFWWWREIGELKEITSEPLLTWKTIPKVTSYDDLSLYESQWFAFDEILLCGPCVGLMSHRYQCQWASTSP
jgi:hypothetical protein